MKKVLVTLLLILCGSLLLACGTDEIKRFSDGVASLSSNELSEHITLKKDMLTVYESNITYTREGNEFKVDSVEKRLNPVGSDEQYATTAKSDIIGASDVFTSDISLKKQYFENFSIQDDVLHAEIADLYIDSVFGTNGCAVTDAVLIVTMTGNKVTRFMLTFRYGEYEGSMVLDIR